MPAGALVPVPSPASPSTTVKPGALVPAPTSSVSLSNTVKPGDFRPALPLLRASVTSNTGSHPRTPEPANPLSPREQFAQQFAQEYGFSLPPLPPRPTDPITHCPYEGRLIKPNPYTLMNSSSTASSSAAEGWNDLGGPTYSSCYQNLISNSFFHPPPLPTQFQRPSNSYRASLARVTTASSRLEHDELLAKFNEQFVHSRMRWHSLKSATSRKEAPPTRESPPSESQSVLTWVAPKQASFTTRPWSYDNVKTYPVMKRPPKKYKLVIKKVVDGEEKEVETEVEIEEVPKKLFNFASKVVLRGH